MKGWIVRIALATLVVGSLFWMWRVFFPSPERIIRKQLLEIEGLVSFAPNEAPLAKLANSRKLANHFTSDVQVTVDLPGHMAQTFEGREDLFQAAMGARSLSGGLQVDFVDVNVVVEPGKQSAVVTMTVKGNVAGDRNGLLQELKLKYVKRDGAWLIQRVETVRTLLQRNDPGGRLAKAARSSISLRPTLGKLRS